MRRIPHRPSVRHRLFHLPLFDWTSAHKLTPLTEGGDWVHRRHHIPRELANLIAELAGIGREHKL